MISTENNLSMTDYSQIGAYAGQMFTQSRDESLESIKENIDDIRNQIEERRELNRQIISALEKAEIEVSNFLSSYRFGLENQEGRESTRR